MNIPHWLFRLLPVWEYICPKCQKEVPKNSHECPFCRERYPSPLKVPHKLHKDRKALEDYVHKHIFPKVSREHREYLTQFFTVLFFDGFESGDFSEWTGINGSPSVVSDDSHHGTYSAFFDANSEAIYKDVGVQSTLFYWAYMKIVGLPAAGNYVETVGIGGNSWDSGVLLYGF